MNILGESFLKDHHHLLRQEKAVKIIFAALQKVPSNHSHTETSQFVSRLRPRSAALRPQDGRCTDTPQVWLQVH